MHASTWEGRIQALIEERLSPDQDVRFPKNTAPDEWAWNFNGKVKAFSECNRDELFEITMRLAKQLQKYDDGPPADKTICM